jgi:DNA-binding transcriptional ArsR family regulator
MPEIQLPEDEFERFVLLAVVELDLDDETPVHSFDIRECCGERTEHVAFASGGVERARVMRALDALTEAGLLEEAEVTSPVGKGRPAHELAVDPEIVIEALREDEALSEYVTSIRD